jgi:hypothetical protein
MYLHLKEAASYEKAFTYIHVAKLTPEITTELGSYLASLPAEGVHRGLVLTNAALGVL